MPRLLYLMHAYHNRAGVEEHVKTLRNYLRNDYQIFVAFPEAGEIWLIDPQEREYRYPGDRLSVVAPFKAERSEAALRQIMQFIRPDIVHIMHFVYWPLSVFEVVANFSVPLVLSLHDYYLLTPYFTLEGESDPAKLITAEYALAVFKVDISDYLLKRREYLKGHLEKVSVLVAPSEFLRQKLQAVFPLAFEIIPYGIHPFTAKWRSVGAGLNFGYFGGGLPQKGWNYLAAAFAQVYSEHPESRLLLYGGDAPAGTEPPPGMLFQGKFNQADIAAVMSEIDVGVIPSVFPETYSIVLSEVWQAGRPAAVADIGAMGERVIDGINGLKFPPADSAAITAAMKWFIQNDVWRSWQLPQPFTAVAMRVAFDRLYQRLL